MNCVRIKITGSVQGVGFRQFVLMSATLMGVVGEVWNTREGTVELIACHDEQSVLERFVQDLRRGPGRVDSVTAVPEEPAACYDRFLVGATK